MLEVNPLCNPFGSTIPRLELNELCSDSAITQWKSLAEPFSHKPTLLEYDHVGGEIKHKGSQAGFLYLIDEPIPESVDIHKTQPPQWVVWSV